MARNGLLGLLGVLAATAALGAEQPVNPLVQGREPDPIARDFHLPDTPVSGYVPSPEADDETNPGLWPMLAFRTWEVLIGEITVPLGIALMSDELPTHRQ